MKIDHDKQKIQGKEKHDMETNAIKSLYAFYGYKNCCYDCGIENYPIKNLNLEGVTVYLDLCPFCAKRTGIISAEDWRSTIEGIKNSEDWD